MQIGMRINWKDFTINERNEIMKKAIAIAIIAISALTGFGAYRNIGTGTDTSAWTSNYDGVIAAAKQTGYPIVLVMVNSVTCGHCHTMNDLTLSSSEFIALEKEDVFYKVMIDQALVSDTHYAYVWRIYNRYFNDGMFPLIAVLDKNGAVYGSYGNRVTDTRNVSGDIRGWVEAVSTAQVGGVVKVGEEGTVAPAPAESTPTPAQPAAPSAATWAAALKATSSGIVFDANEIPVASVQFKVTKKGVATAKIVTVGGNAKAKGQLSLDAEGRPQVVAGPLSVSYDEKSRLWSGTWGGMLVIIAQGKAVSTGYDGVYTLGAENATGSQAGYVTVTVKGGKGKVAGQIGAKTKVSANNAVLPLSAASVGALLQGNEEDEAADALFATLVKLRKSSGGVAIAKTGEAAGFLTVGGSNWLLEGAKWDTAKNATALDGLSLIFVTGGKPAVPLTAKSVNKMVSLDANYGAKVSVQPKKGTFKGSAKLNGARSKFVGVLIKEGDAIRGFGTSFGAAGTFPIWIE